MIKKTQLTELQRLKKVVKWLIFSDFGDNEKELSELLGYSKSSFSQIINGKVPISDKFINKLIDLDENINKVWIKKGEGDMLKETEPKVSIIQKPPSEFQKFISRTDRIEQDQMIPVYDMDAVAGIVPLISDMSNQEPIDHIYIPNAPKCDGAMYATGDSMYPLLKSGDILAFKTITDLANDIFYGEMYIIYIEVAGDSFRTVKFIHRGDEKDHIKLVSQNRHHQDKEVHLSKIQAMAQVKASIRVH